MAGIAAEVILLEGWDKRGQLIFGSSRVHHVEITHDPRDMRVSSVTLQQRKEKTVVYSEAKQVKGYRS